jgi:hypothetical protein
VLHTEHADDLPRGIDLCSRPVFEPPILAGELMTKTVDTDNRLTVCEQSLGHLCNSGAIVRMDDAPPERPVVKKFLWVIPKNFFNPLADKVNFALVWIIGRVYSISNLMDVLDRSTGSFLRWRGSAFDELLAVRYVPRNAHDSDNPFLLEEGGGGYFRNFVCSIATPHAQYIRINHTARQIRGKGRNRFR